MGLSQFERFKLSVLSVGEVSDYDVITLFLDLEVESEGEIRESVGCLKIHRAAVFAKFENLATERHGR